jgi:hypothetical protein
MRLYRAYIGDEVLGPVGMPVDDEALKEEAPPLDLVPPGGEMLLVTLAGEPVAIGGIRGQEHVRGALGTPARNRQSTAGTT